jgi:hypothetical protein
LLVDDSAACGIHLRDISDRFMSALGAPSLRSIALQSIAPRPDLAVPGINQSNRQGLLMKNFTWISIAGGNWNNPANWDQGVVPAPGDQVTIPTLSGGSAIILGADLNLLSLTIQGGNLILSPGVPSPSPTAWRSKARSAAARWMCGARVSAPGAAR